jgi:3-oxoacyl-[acyl-carrier-protein] synthase-1
MRCVISGLGLVCSVGHDVALACAAIRAGIARPAPVGEPMMSDDGPDLVSITGHPVQGLTDGYVFVGRWLRLALYCLDDLRQSAQLPEAKESEFWERTALLTVIPEEMDQRVHSEEPVDNELVMKRYTQRVIEKTPLPAGHVQIVRAGHCGVLAAVKQAQQMLCGGTADRAIILATDSFVESGSLAWLAGQGRLKEEDYPTGVSPGEAGAALLVETEAAARRRGVSPGAFLSNVVAFEDPHFDCELGHGNGRALAAALRQATPAAGEQRGFAGDVVVDFNGENSRATDFGMARTRLTDIWADEVNVVVPATSVGDTGAASGAVGVCVAVRSFERDYARTNEVLVASRSNDGEVAAVCLTKPE